MKSRPIGLRRASLGIAGLVTVSTACTAFYPARASDLTPRRPITVAFDEPRDLEARHDTVVYRLSAVQSVYGRVVSVRSDTLVLRVLALESSQRQPRLPDAARVTIVPGSTDHLSAERVSRGRTWALVGVTVAGLIALFLATLEFPTPVPGY
ncbi:MAG TPA: hypothetical protein VFU01_08640 [Gemmatimonadaceae bacterium]|nr:hypothetical protein [Gemmatimonadaceae bacterium]